MATGELGGQSRLITGSLQGVLRVYTPREGFSGAGDNVEEKTEADEGKEEKSGSAPRSSAEDLILEQNLGSPILQVEIGRFVSTGRRNDVDDSTFLAVLHPFVLTVYDMVPVKGSDGTFELQKYYTHKLGVDGAHFTSYAMVHGPFGGVKGADFIAVLSMDGQLQVLEQDTFGFIRKLNHMLLPGPIAYVPSIDSFVVCNSQMMIDCYKYHSLTGNRVGKREQTDTGKQNTEEVLLQTDWTLNVGEIITGVFPARLSGDLASTQSDIVLLGEQTLFYVSEGGAIKLQKRILADDSGFCPILATAYDRESKDGVEGGHQNLIIIDAEGAIQVYKGPKMVWGAALPSRACPVGARVLQIGKLRGLLATLDEAGKVLITYMGTDPPVATSNNADDDPAAGMSYERMDEEHRKLLKQIKASRGSSAPSSVQQPLTVRIQVPTYLDVMSIEDAALASSSDPDRRLAYDESGKPVQLTVRLHVIFSGLGRVTNASISLSLPPGVRAPETTFSVPELKGGGRTPFIQPVSLMLLPFAPPSSAEFSVAVTYVDADGHQRGQSISARLPLWLFASVRTPIKSGSFKLTVESSAGEPPLISALFDDMFQQPGISPELISTCTSAANVMSFRLRCGDEATILLSKKGGGRYRIQATSMAAAWIVLDELEKRLGAHYRAASSRYAASPFRLSLADSQSLPFGDLISYIDAHFRLRVDVIKAASELNDRSHQIRTIQKRLLARFKDRNAKPLDGMDVLMRDTHEQVIDVANRIEMLKGDLQVASAQLSCAVRTFNFLLRMQFNLDHDEARALEDYFSPHVLDFDSSDMGWEECTDAALTYLLRTSLAKSPSGDQGGSRGYLAGRKDEFECPDSTKKLVKHFRMVCDRLSRGARLIKSGAGCRF